VYAVTGQTATCSGDGNRSHYFTRRAYLLVASLIRSAFGFGEALIAVPLLAFFIPLEVAAQAIEGRFERQKPTEKSNA